MTVVVSVFALLVCVNYYNEYGHHSTGGGGGTRFVNSSYGNWGFHS